WADVQNTNNTTIRSILLAEKLSGLNFTNWYRNLRIVLRYKKKINFVEQPTRLAHDPETANSDNVDKYYETVNLEQEVSCLMLSKEQAKQELFETVKAFHGCKQEEGQLVSSYLLKMKSYFDTLERLGYAMLNELGVSLILNSFNKDIRSVGRGSTGGSKPKTDAKEGEGEVGIGAEETDTENVGFGVKNHNSFDVEETLWPNKGNGDSSIAIPTSLFPSLAEVSHSYTNSGRESCNEVNLVPSMFDTNSKSVCGMEGITPTGATGASNSKQLKSKVNFRPMVAEKVFDGVHISIPQKVVKKVNGHFENTLYDYFIEAVLDGGPWMIHNSPIILKKWSMGTSLLKEELTQIPIWVKLHDVPLQVFKDDGISLIASYLGKPIMLDSYTSLMCKDSWGRSSFARCLIEINLAVDFKESITIGIPDLEGPESCPKKFVVTSIVNDNNDGFQQVVNKRRNNKRSSAGNKLPKGVPVAKGFQVKKEFNYQPRAPSAGSNGGGNRGEASSKAGPSKDTNVDASVTTKGNQNDRQQENDVVDTRASTPAHTVLLKDFNAALNLEDHSCGGYEPNISMREFKECAMYRVVKQLKGLKTPIRKLLHDQGNLHERVNCLRVELDEAQKAIERNPSCSLLRDEHAHYLLDVKEASLDEERFLRQKCKIEWLNARDSNTAYFHKIVKSKCVRNIIEIVTRVLEGTTTPLDDHRLFSQVLSDHNADFMVREVSDIEIKGALFSIGDDKPPGPDGFNAAFFKKSWDIVGDGSSIANHGFLTSIVRFIANRIKGYLGDLVSINQSAFVPGRRISNNILLTQELMRNYHRKRSPPRCAFKVDIQKAYDTVDWGFLRSILVGFGFHPTMVDWIMVCVTTTSYSISINGDMHGWFNGKRGLKQGDPLSPYLFTLVMEVLTLILQRRVQNAEDFQYHHLCEQQRIVNLCFVDDLFLFARGHPNSVRVIMDALEEFKNVSGLVPSIPKSIAFFCNVPNALKVILSSMPFAEDTLPVRYLSVPLISSRLLYRDCKVLIEKLESRVNDWRNKILSSTSMWFDRWADPCLLRDMLTVRNIVCSGFSLSSTVSDLISNGSWRWPHDWSSRFPNVVNIPVQDINNDLDDVIVWHDVQGVFQRFSVAGAWDSLRLRADVVDWYHVVWFPHCIYCHAIYLWLVIKEKLKTQDRLRQ
ncbi:protein LAZ1, partial [Tanacetum coccineum]